MERCDKCKYYLSVSDDGNGERGECMANPPTQDSEGCQNDYPRVYADSLCRFFEKKIKSIGR